MYTPISILPFDVTLNNNVTLRVKASTRKLAARKAARLYPGQLIKSVEAVVVTSEQMHAILQYAI
jgi:hypothetical protein